VRVCVCARALLCVCVCVMTLTASSVKPGDMQMAAEQATAFPTYPVSSFSSRRAACHTQFSKVGALVYFYIKLTIGRAL